MKNTEYFYDYPRYSNLKELLGASIKKYAENPAFLFKDKRKITYREFGEQVKFFGNGLFQLGMKDRKSVV